MRNGDEGSGQNWCRVSERTKPIRLVGLFARETGVTPRIPSLFWPQHDMIDFLSWFFHEWCRRNPRHEVRDSLRKIAPADSEGHNKARFHPILDLRWSFRRSESDGALVHLAAAVPCTHLRQVHYKRAAVGSIFAGRYRAGHSMAFCPKTAKERSGSCR
jgi:hypothetical protein